MVGSHNGPLSSFISHFLFEIGVSVPIVPVPSHYLSLTYLLRHVCLICYIRQRCIVSDNIMSLFLSLKLLNRFSIPYFVLIN